MYITIVLLRKETASGVSTLTDKEGKSLNICQVVRQNASKRTSVEARVEAQV